MDAKNVLLLAFSVVLEAVLLSTLFNSYDICLDLVLPRVNEKSAGFEKLERVEVVAQKEMSGQTLCHEAPVMPAATLETPLGVLEIQVQEGRNLRNVEFGGTSDPYCVIHLGDEKWATTKTIDNW
ncbi:hypothetical protein HDU81_000173 [Chytriomyces hyalinus]|nr:hypothetical protein HDU81_000173 [Chytriomyces hyalinus]